MKMITINVSEPVYQVYQEAAKKMDLTSSELIRDAMEAYLKNLYSGSQSILDLMPVSVGKILVPPSQDDDLLDEMLS
jgi:metal-responsive CopG/Arc/MetJ family transcriptional regulator